MCRRNLALFPTMSVRSHLAFALLVRHWDAGPNCPAGRRPERVAGPGCSAGPQAGRPSAAASRSAVAPGGEPWLTSRASSCWMNRSVPSMKKPARKMYELLRSVQRCTGGYHAARDP